jgi:hypothetical protein
MPLSDTPIHPPARLRRNFILLILAVAVLVVGWSIYWWVVTDRVETMLREALVRPLPDGTVVVCDPLAVAGYPFRVEARCGTVAATLPDGGTLAAGSFTAVALAYDWRKAIFELDGPLAAEPVDGPRIDATWQTARASGARDGRLLASANLVLEQPMLTVDGREAGRADHLEIHLRRAPATQDAATEVLPAGTDAAFSATGLASPLLPLPLDVSVVVRVGDDGAALAGRGPLFEGIGDEPLPVSLRELTLASGAAKLRAAGDVTVDPEGRLDGRLDVTIADPAALAATLRPLLPPDSPLPVALAGAVAAFGRDDGDGQRTVTVTIRRGRAAIGLIPLGRLPRLPVRALTPS